MKILNRLRELWVSPRGIEADGFGTLIGAGEMDVEEFSFQQGMDANDSTLPPGVGTLDGLRRRITGVHEEFPPGAVSQDDGDDAA